MFDTVKVDNSVNYPNTIVEKKAPTDDSIRLYKEIKEKAMTEIIKEIHIKNNIVEGVALIYTATTNIGTLPVHLRFKVNGKEYLEKIEIDRSIFDNNKSILTKIYERISNIIASIMLLTCEKIY